MRLIDVEQGSEEWFKARCGIPTASNFDKIVDIKGNRSKQREGYLYQLAGERITKKPEETYQSEAMKRGKELEDEARQIYGIIKKVKVEKVGLYLTEGRYVYGASPDGINKKQNRLLEVKCPIMKTHVYYLIKNQLPSDYFQQTQGQLLVSGNNWLDFVSYYPGMKPLIIPVKADKIFQAKLRKELEVFCLELDKIVRIVK
jgi:putative phage-type endonuclease